MSLLPRSSPRTRARRLGVRVLAALVAVAAFSSCNEGITNPTQLPVPTGPAESVGPTGVPLRIEYFIQAHQDDWQLFFGDRAASAAHTANKLVFVYTTAGASDNAGGYAAAREQAANASVDTITLGVAGPWACAFATVNGHSVYRCTRANTVSYYFRLPNPGDGRPNGMSDLRDGRISLLRSVDGTGTYTSWSDLVTTIRQIFVAENGAEPEFNIGIHAPETDRDINDGDHSDHLASGDLAAAATTGHNFNRFWYLGYPNQYEPQNVFGAALAAKWGTVYAYDHVMKRLMGETIIGTSGAEQWVPRTIERVQLSSGPPPPPPPPTAPTNLVAAPAAGVAINLTWTDNSGNEDGFKIERAPDVSGVAGTYAQIASVGANVNTYTNTGLEANVRYWYRVVAYNGDGASTYSNQSSAILTAPPAPSGLAASTTVTSINLTWTDNSSAEQGFNIERAPDVGGVAGTYAQIASVGANVNAYANTGLEANVRYWYRVVAFNDIGPSSYSNEASAILLPPNAPSALAATTGVGNSINLSWTDNSSDEQGFNIERAPDAGGVAGTYAQIASVGANVRTYANTGLDGNVRYWYRVVAFNDIGASSYSNEASAILLPPNAPSALAATSGVGTSINLSWTDNSSDEQGFNIERAPDVGGVAGTYAQIGSVGANVRTYTNTGLEGNVRYWYRAVAYNTIGTSGYSNEASAILLPPNAPSALAATPGVGTSINLSWTDNSSDEQGFNIERAPDVGGVAGTYAQIGSVGANVRTYTNTGLEGNVRYWYRAVAYSVIGTSTYSNEASAILLPPNAPSALAATPGVGTSINLTWTDNSSDEQGFNIERAPDAGGVAGTYAQIASVGANVNAYTNTGLEGNVRYWYRVVAYSVIGTSTYSNEASAILLPPNAPSALAATPAAGSTISLSWTDNSSNEQGFNIERAPDVGGVAGTYAQIASVGANVRTYSNGGLQLNVRYFYRVAAYNVAGASGYSNEASAILATSNGPTGLTATAASATRIDLAWTDNSTDETGFRIERAPDVGGVAGTYAQIATVAANVVTYANTTGLVAGTRYWYRVASYNALGNSPYSPEANATTVGLPVAPTALSATPNNNGTRIDLAWTDNATNEQGFRIERAPDVAGAPGTFALLTSVGANVRTYNNSGLANGIRYWYRVRAYNTAGNSAYTNIADATTLRLPAVPSNLQAVATGPKSVDVTWTDNADNEVSYRLDRAPDNAGVPGGWSQVGGTLAANVTSYTNTGLTSSTNYWYRVRAQNTVGNSAYTAAVLVTTQPPAPPSNLAVRAYLIGTQRNAELTWTIGSEAKIDIWRGTVKLRSNINNTGTRNETSGTAQGTHVPYQVCLVGKTDAASCTAVVYADY